MASNEFVLHPCPGLDDGRLLISLKLNNQLQSLLASEKCDSDFEIEFTSFSAGKIYCGLSVFNLKFSESAVLEVYRSQATFFGNGRTSLQKEDDLNFCGTAANRYQVITSLETASEDLRLKRKREADLKERKSTKTVDLVHSHSTRKKSHISFVPPQVIGRFPLLKAPCTAPLISSSDKSTQDSRKKRAINRIPAATDQLNHSKILTNRSINDDNQHPNWMVISGLPDTVCSADIGEFLNGIKIRDTFGYYFYESSVLGERVPSNFMDVYVLFESKSGVEAALMRHGELITTSIVSANQNKSNSNAPKDSQHSESGQRVSVVASLDRVGCSEASWARVLSVRLGFSRQSCRTNIDMIRNAFSPALLSTSPLDSSVKWFDEALKCKYISPEEVCSYTDHPKKLNFVQRYGYHENDSIYLDAQQISCGFGFLGASGLSSYSVVQNADISDGEESASAAEDGSPRLKEVGTILEHLTGVLSNALLSSYSTSADVDVRCYTHVNPVLDLAHRMSFMYTDVQNKLKNI